MVRFSLRRKLEKRPSMEVLVEWGVLPKECAGGLAPALIETKRKVERERVKDGLRAWVEEWRIRGCERVRNSSDQKPDVGRLVKRFAGLGKNGEVRLGSGVRRAIKDPPARANVLGLRKFWEGLGHH